MEFALPFFRELVDRLERDEDEEGGRKEGGRKEGREGGREAIEETTQISLSESAAAAVCKETNEHKDEIIFGGGDGSCSEGRKEGRKGDDVSICLQRID